MRRLLPVLALFALIALAQPAHAAPPSAVPTVTCTMITIDPEPGEGVTFTGTIGNTHISAPGIPVAGTHTSQADISTLTTANGPIAYEITPQWVIAENTYGVTSGPGPTVTGTLTCHESSTTTSASTSSTSTTSAAPSTLEGTTVAPLPRTGSSSGSLAIVGLLSVPLGLALAMARRRRA